MNKEQTRQNSSLKKININNKKVIIDFYELYSKKNFVFIIYLGFDVTTNNDILLHANYRLYYLFNKS